ncbi:MAG: enoyl-CoA hydratase/isomerase family protein [Deltaproteobacteria bacterium]|nr:enoyl-CoA hydratase/isomerase family protein [Deltaproteobacteria bacterium]MBW2399401.1 enoyl-CoA hydratase/isomerase family protein [Deltaproteobacteria bacterium]
MPGTPEFLYEKKDHIAIMTFNRAEKRNSFTPEMIDALYECFDDFKEDPDLYVAVFASTGEKAWCSGGDLDAMIPAITSGEFKINTDPTKRVYSDIYKPIITAVNGFATLELILGADMCVASRNASFALGEVRWGMIPAGGSHVRLPRAIPWNVAMEVLLTGRPLDAQRAYEVGLVNRLVDAPADALPEAMRLAELVCENGPLAVQTCKEICVRAWEHERAFVLENALFQKVRDSEDAQEGPRAYMEKRKAQFSGR